MRLGFIGYGEAAFEMSYGLKQEGIIDIFAYNHLTREQVVERADKAQVVLLSSPEELLNNVEVVIIAVPADKALGVSERIKPYLKKEHLYVDVSASSPQVKKSIGKLVETSGAVFVDAQMMGPLPIHKHKVPILASGKGTNQLINLMVPFGMDITKVGEHAGDASAIKLIRSIFMKGISVLLIEVLEAANHLKVDELVLSSIKETMQMDFEQMVNRLITGTSIHSARRAVEIEGSIEMLNELNIDSTMSTAVRNKLELLSSFNIKDQIKGKTPDNWKDVITLLQDLKMS